MRLLFASISTQSEAALSVAQLAQQIKGVLESDPILCDISVRGEISNFTAHRSGHLYFTLKDDNAQIRCCMWRGNAFNLRFRPTEGDRVVAYGRVEFYAVRGEVSFIVETLHFAGQGALMEAFERLKEELAAEGLFDAERKQPLPLLPRCIGLITSPTGAVLHDVLTVLRRRWPLTKVVVIPAAVQGFNAAPDLMRALSWAGTLPELDVVIMARGGGSAEDLWCFNDEDLARAVAAFPKPLISAIGHETDFTILDFVADVRAPTPSAAAELVVPSRYEVQAELNGIRRRLHQAVAGDVRLARQRLDTMRRRRVLTDPLAPYRQWHARVQELRTRVRAAVERRVKIERQTVAWRRAQLRALDPRRVLERGYALVTDAATGNVVTSARQPREGQNLRILLHDGTIDATVDGIDNSIDNE
jgi:exodeoxyribonuclease VII large subunit